MNKTNTIRIVIPNKDCYVTCAIINSFRRLCGIPVEQFQIINENPDEDCFIIKENNNQVDMALFVLDEIVTKHKVLDIPYSLFKKCKLWQIEFIFVDFDIDLMGLQFKITLHNILCEIITEIHKMNDDYNLNKYFEFMYYNLMTFKCDLEIHNNKKMEINSTFIKFLHMKANIKNSKQYLGLSARLTYSMKIKNSENSSMNIEYYNCYLKSIGKDVNIIQIFNKLNNELIEYEYRKDKIMKLKNFEQDLIKKFDYNAVSLINNLYLCKSKMIIGYNYYLKIKDFDKAFEILKEVEDILIKRFYKDVEYIYKEKTCENLKKIYMMQMPVYELWEKLYNFYVRRDGVDSVEGKRYLKRLIL